VINFLCDGCAAKMKVFASEIYAAVRAGKLAEPFSAITVRHACPGWSRQSYAVFLPKHAFGNSGGNTELFKRTSPGQYRTLEWLHPAAKTSKYQTTE
jgi:hypothetical protein